MSDDRSTSSGEPGPEDGGEAPVASGDETELISPSDPDTTASTSPVDPDATGTVPPVDPDATAVVPPVDPDATAVVPPVDPDATAVVPPVDPDATAVVPDPDSAPTHVIRPPTPDPTKALPVISPTWRGSAGVRAGDPSPDVTSAWSPQEPSNRGWWLPIVIGIVGLLILVGVAYALVHELKNSGQPVPVTSPAPPATANTLPATPSTVPSAVPSAPPSTPPSAPPSPSPSLASPSASGPAVVIPSTLTGLLFTDAGSELNALGLKYQLQPQVDDDPSVLPDQVLSTNPAPGTAVAPGTVVTLVYATKSASASAIPS